MKGFKLVVLIGALICTFTACKKNNDLPSGKDDDKYTFGVTRVLGVKGSDTVSTRFMGGRVETIGVLSSDQDSKMRAELIGYQNLGSGKAMYTVKAVNLTDCQQLVRWHWIGGLLVDSIIPMDDAVYAHDSTTFKIYGNISTGAITLNAQAVDPNNCGNSRTLTLVITTAILPTRFTASTVSRVNDKMIVKFTDQMSQDTDWYLVMWSPTGDPKEEIKVLNILSNPDIKDYTVTFPAFKKSGK